MDFCHLLLDQTLVHLKVQFQHPFCLRCIQLTVEALMSHVVKFADDTELVGKSSNDKNYLYLNVSKTKELCIDFRKNQRCPKPVYIKGEAVERVDTYKYLGVVFDSNVNWKENINSVLKKVNLRMYCMRKLRSLGENSDMLVTFL